MEEVPFELDYEEQQKQSENAYLVTQRQGVCERVTARPGAARAWPGWCLPWEDALLAPSDRGQGLLIAVSLLGPVGFP